MSEHRPRELHLTELQWRAFEEALAALGQHEHVVLTGSTGVGKSHLAQQLAAMGKGTILSYSALTLRPFELDKAALDIDAETVVVIDGLDVMPPSGVRDFVIELIRLVASKGGRLIMTVQQMPKWLVGWGGMTFREVSVPRPVISDDLLNELPPVEIYVDPGGASNETLRELFDAINDLHVAAGGLGLEFKTEGNSVFMVSEVEQ